MDIKEEVEGLIFIDEKPSQAQKDLISKVVALSERKLLAKLPKEVTEIPDELSYIVVEVSIKRYNRIGSEGMAREEVDGRDQEFQDNDFKDFEDDINSWIDNFLEEKGTARRIRFL